MAKLPTNWLKIAGLAESADAPPAANDPQHHKHYTDSASFTDEFSSLSDAIKSPRMMKWMELTDENYGTDCVGKLHNLIAAVNVLWDEIDKAQ